MALVISLRMNWPELYVKVGSPSIFIISFEVWIPLERVRRELSVVEYRRLSTFRVLTVGFEAIALILLLLFIFIRLS